MLRRFARLSSSPLFGEIVTLEVPSLGDSITEGVVADINFEVGQKIPGDSVVVSLETDKVMQDIAAIEGSGILTEILTNVGDTVYVGDPLVKMELVEEEDESSQDDDVQESESAPTKSKKKAAPAAPPAPPKKAPAAPPKGPAIDTSELENRVPMSKMRQRIAERLKDAQNTNAILTTFNEIDMHNIMSIRSKYKDIFLDKHQTKLGFMSAFLKASAVALRENPVINASIDPATNSHIIYRNYVDISVAVATPTGLVVPVVRNVDKMSFADIEKEMLRLAMKAREGNISMDDMTGGTFTISNGGVYGSLMGTPIINPPQASILGMHGIFKRPVVVSDSGKDEIVIRPMMNVALSYDHRLIDGRDAVTFLTRIKELVQDPIRLVLDV